MQSTMKKMTCRALVVALLVLSFQTANAGMISTDRAAHGAPVDRAMVLSGLDRAETAVQLQALGIDPALARARVAAMTDAEVQAMAQDMHNAPAGAMSGLALAAFFVVLVLIWNYAYRN